MREKGKYQLTREEALAYVERWRLVNEKEREELRALTPAEKFQQVLAMNRVAKRCGWWGRTPADEAEAEQVRERWRQLRESYRDG